MSLIDITGNEIYNPHIRIYTPGSNTKFTCMNSTSFGEEGQENLIFPETINGNLETRDRHYRVTAVVTEQSRFGHKRPQISGEVISETILEYLNQEAIISIYEKNNVTHYLSPSK